MLRILGYHKKENDCTLLAFRNDLQVQRFIFPERYGQCVKLQDFLSIDENLESFYIDRADTTLKQNVTIQRDMFGNYPQKTIRVGIVNKGGQGERIYSPLGHAITLSAYGGGVGAKTGLYFIDNKIRKLTPKECLRIMGFPEHFMLSPKHQVAYKQLGNSIVVNVLKAIIAKIIEQKIV